MLVSNVSLKHNPQNFHGGQVTDHSHKWKKLTSNRIKLQMFRQDTIELENDIPTKKKMQKLLVFLKRKR